MSSKVDWLQVLSSGRVAASMANGNLVKNQTFLRFSSLELEIVRQISASFQINLANLVRKS